MIPAGPWLYLVWVPALIGGLLLFAASSAGTWTPALRARLRLFGSWLAIGTGLPAVVATGAFAVLLTGDWALPAILLAMTGSATRLVADLNSDRVWAKRLTQAGLAVETVGATWWAYLVYGPKNAVLIVATVLAFVVVLSVAIRFVSNFSKARSSGPSAH